MVEGNWMRVEGGGGKKEKKTFLRERLGSDLRRNPR